MLFPKQLLLNICISPFLPCDCITWINCFQKRLSNILTFFSLQNVYSEPQACCDMKTKRSVTTWNCLGLDQDDKHEFIALWNMLTKLILLQLWPPLCWELSSVLVDPRTGAKTPRLLRFVVQSPTANRMSGTSLMWSVLCFRYGLSSPACLSDSEFYFLFLENCAMWPVQRGSGCGGQTGQGQFNAGELMERWQIIPHMMYIWLKQDDQIQIKSKLIDWIQNLCSDSNLCIKTSFNGLKRPPVVPVCRLRSWATLRKCASWFLMKACLVSARKLWTITSPSLLILLKESW